MESSISSSVCWPRASSGRRYVPYQSPVSQIHTTTVLGPYHYCPRSIPLLSQIHTTIVPDPYHYCPRSIPLHTKIFYFTILTERYVIVKHVMIVVQISSHHFHIVLISELPCVYNFTSPLRRTHLKRLSSSFLHAAQHIGNQSLTSAQVSERQRRQ